MEAKLAGAGKEVLVEIVKLIQRKGMRGEKGEWKEFLELYDKELGSNLSDPARRSTDVLLSFIKTFTAASDLKLFEKMIKCRSKFEVAKQYVEPKNDESPVRRLIRLTLEHPHYPIDYSFPSHEEDWVITKSRKKNKEGRLERLLAVDCEMVLCQDGSEALVKICVVDRDLKVQLDEFVKPGKKVVDYRTSITGVSAEDARRATFTLVDVQNSMKKLLSRGTILVGHSLSNDLKALKIDHARVIDTSFIFKYGDESMQIKPSLNNLCKSVLGVEVRKDGATHDCLEDARAAMKLALAKMEHGFDDVLPAIEDKVELQKVGISQGLSSASLEPGVSLATTSLSLGTGLWSVAIQTSSDHAMSGTHLVPDSGMNKLLIHRIPISVPSEDLNQIIHGEFTIEVQNNKKGKGERYSALATFRTPEEALQAFENIKGEDSMDSHGLPQKSVSVELSSGEKDTIYIRKMTRESHPEKVTSRKRQCPTEETSDGHKLPKTAQVTDDEEGEINRLKGLVTLKDEEIKLLKSLVRLKDEEMKRMKSV